MFTFSGRGYGHGVGLCQAGALARLRAGAKPVDVLRYYYPGAVLAQGSGLRQALGSKLWLWQELKSGIEAFCQSLEP